ncbi:AaceriADL233Wp [[Ashbya] aceris (nom. inval.)]|nr:AaceriADL233Wp [[Ashbya] aceris (nom. inval.)]
MKLPAVLEERRTAAVDRSTLSNYEEFAVRHTRLELEVAFDEREIRAEVSYELEQTGEGVAEVRLDTSYVHMECIMVDGKRVPWELRERQEPLGSQLVITPEGGLPARFRLTCRSVTTARSTAVQWLDGAQTAGQPYVYTQLETVHARSLVPCFDTPACKSPFTVRVRSPLRVVVAGQEQPGSGKDGVYLFEQPVPIPIYLLGLAAGDIACAPLGPRSNVYCEPALLEAAVGEFEGEIERFLDAAEQLLPAYIWGNYNLLVSPASYPYGGMEVAGTSFISPSVIAYDRSNNDLIVHEMAHSWSGNLITNANWSHFWLNEGWTVYLERRITGALHGEETRQFSALLGMAELEAQIRSSNGSSFALVQDVSESVNPDNIVSLAAYEKGSALLLHLERELGGTAAFDPFIKHYFGNYGGRSLTTWQFLDILFEFFADRRDKLESIDWRTWLFAPGMPPKLTYSTSLADDVYDLVEQWLEKAVQLRLPEEFATEFSGSVLAAFTTAQQILFLNTIIQGGVSPENSFDWTQHPVAAAALLSVYSDTLGKSRNQEIIFRRYNFQLAAGMQDTYSEIITWLGSTGRMKHVRPIYRRLAAIDRTLATTTFEEHREKYHPICRAAIQADLDLT